MSALLRCGTLFKRSARLSSACLLALVLPALGTANPQELNLDQGMGSTWSRSQSLILRKTDSDIKALIRQSRTHDLSPEEADDLYLVALARPEVALQAFEQALAEGLRARELPDHKIAQFRDFIAYAGNEESLRVLAKLRSEFDEPLLKGGVLSLLSYAEGRQDPFRLAYSATALSDPLSREEVLTWLRVKISHPEGVREWAEAIISHEEAGKAATSVLDDDPLASGLHDLATVAALRVEIERRKSENDRRP
jgi:hypothetical protein